MSAVAAAIESTTILEPLEVETNSDTVTFFGLGAKILQILVCNWLSGDCGAGCQLVVEPIMVEMHLP